MTDDIVVLTTDLWLAAGKSPDAFWTSRYACLLILGQVPSPEMPVNADAVANFSHN